MLTQCSIQNTMRSSTNKHGDTEMRNAIQHYNMLLNSSEEDAAQQAQDYSDACTRLMNDDFVTAVSEIVFSKYENFNQEIFLKEYCDFFKKKTGKEFIVN